ncbi:hypothetical protein [Streptacidiphilus sp. P02-A3a]|uniref:hypothetical protein n=1 Tax=Streptacidiphilus sp. P02-A3a TaxID=2704468 RepID=UPI0015F91030|nr:hypothetical protein [Streptacidiphilus sp. P02-A3a]QMU71271.1 hypothetical protein GXP74_26645 [Streptacidiphilus sp. P02-A3a]
MTGEPEPISQTARRALEQELTDLRSERETVAATLRDHDPGNAGDQADELQRATGLTRLDDRTARSGGRGTATVTALSAGG